MNYSPEMVTLLQQLRSRIFAEFGVKIRLVDPELLGRLADMGRRSRDPFTRKTVVKIMSLGNVDYTLDDPVDKVEVDAKAKEAASDDNDYETIIYRGNKIQRKRQTPATESFPPRTEKKTSVQMYRGQVVNKS